MWPAQIIAEIVMNCCGPFERLNPIVSCGPIWDVLYISGTFWDVFLYLCFSRVGISSGSLSEPPLSLGTCYMLIVKVQYCLDTYPEGMIERDAIVPFF